MSPQIPIQASPSQASALITTGVVQFSPQHLVALLLLAASCVGSVLVARHAPSRSLVALERGLALCILLTWIGEYVAEVIVGTWTVQYSLPLQLTDAVSAVAVLALLSRRQLLVELLYFWALTASLQAVLTPDLQQQFPSVFYFTYFGYHIGAIVAASLLVFGRRLYPRPRAALRVWGLTLVVAVVAGAGDLITGGNYMYLRQKPVHASLLSVMAGWPWYIFEAAVVGLALLLVLEMLTALVTGSSPPRGPSEIAVNPRRGSELSRRRRRSARGPV